MSELVDRAIVTLNSLHIGEVSRIARRLEEVRKTLSSIPAPELVEKIEEAHSAIRSGDVPLFRRRIQNIVSRLGHMR